MHAIEVDAHVKCVALGERPFSLTPQGAPPENHPDRKEWEALSAETSREISARMQVLLNHYHIDSAFSDPFCMLALRLANDLIPNFTVFPNPPGRRRGREIPSDTRLCMAVDKIADERKRGIADACRLLSRRAGPWEGANPNTLETRYHEEKSRLIFEIAREIATEEIDITRYRK